MKRAKAIFEKEGIYVQPFPVDFKSSKNFNLIFLNPLSWLPSANSLQRTSAAFREMIGQIFYGVWK